MYNKWERTRVYRWLKHFMLERQSRRCYTLADYVSCNLLNIMHYLKQQSMLSLWISQLVLLRKYFNTGPADK